MDLKIGDILVAQTDTRNFHYVKKHVDYDNIFGDCEGNFSIKKNETCMVVKLMLNEKYENYVIAYVLKENAYIWILQLQLQMSFKKL